METMDKKGLGAGRSVCNSGAEPPILDQAEHSIQDGPPDVGFALLTRNNLPF